MSVGKKIIEAAAGVGGGSPQADSGTSDDDFANVVLLLDGNGTSGDDNNTFTDSSSNGYTITESGSVVQGSFSPYGSVDWGYYTKDSRVLLSSAFSTTGDYTAECWVYVEGYDPSGYNNIFVGNSNNTQLSLTPVGGITLVMSGAVQIDGSATDMGVNTHTWHHIAWTRSGSTCRIFLDGTQVASATSTAAIQIQNFLGWSGNGYELEGYISNVRVNSNALYTSNFTPSTSPLTDVSGTHVLAFNSNRLVDTSSNGYTFSLATGSWPKAVPFSPFKDEDTRTITVDGGSGYFNGSSYLQVPTGYLSGVTTGDFTIEGWWYFNDFAIHTSYFQRLWSFGTGLADDVTLNVFTDGDLCFRINDGIVVQTSVSGGLLNLYEWNHIALVRSSGTVNIYVNGTSVVSGSFTSNISTKVSDPLYIGSEAGGGGGYLSGFCSDVRVLDSALYTSSFTSPTAPLTTVTNTNLLLNFQDAGIYDRSGNINLDTINNTQIDTAQKKYGTGSIEFDGTADYITANEEIIRLGTGDFTVEAWIYWTAVEAWDSAILDARNTNGSSTGWVLNIRSANKVIRFYTGSTGYDGSTATSQNTWHHVAVTRQNGTVRIFLDGTLDATHSVSTNFTDTAIRIGQGVYANSDWNGYIEDLRVTKGLARYTSSFTAPTAELGKF